MSIKHFAFALLLLPVMANAQKKNKSAIKAANAITVADLKEHLYTIASKEMEGRDTPSPGLEKAADYIANYLKSLGYAPGNNGSYKMYYPLYRDLEIKSTVNVNGETIVLNGDYQNINGTQGYENKFSEVVFAGYGIKDSARNDFEGLNLKDKLVLVVDGTPPGYKPSGNQRGFMSPASAFGKISTATQLGAAAVMVVYNNFPRKPMAMQARWSTRDPNAAGTTPFMAISVSEKVAEIIMGQDGKDLATNAKSGNLKSKTYTAAVRLSYHKEIETSKAPNVIAIMEGTDKKDEYLLITAHMDHLGKRGDSIIYYGADDDGSGTVGVMSVAKAFAEAKAKGKGPRRSVVIMTVSGEEKGLWGSAYYAEHPVYPLDKTTADLNIDMIGRTDDTRKVGDSTNYVYVVGDDKLSTDLKKISEGVNKLYTKMELDYKFNDPKDPNRIYFRSDHYNFAAKGVPVIFYYDGMLGADYHKPTDTPDKINYDLLRKRAQLVFYTGWEMANRDAMLKRDLKLEEPK